MAKSSSYWKRRFSVLENSQNQYSQQTFHNIEPAFDKAQRQIQSQIETWYARYANNNGITMAEARKQLSAAELKELKWDVKEYIKYGRENAINEQWMQELENASARFHISRLEALKLRTQQAYEVAYGNELDSVDSMVRNIYQDSYYHTCFEVQKGFNIGWEIGQIDDRKLQKVISKPWTTDGMTFSDRVWKSKNQMIGELHQQLTRTIIQGKAPDEAIKHMTKYLNDRTKNAKYQAGRLVMTEQAFFSSAAQKEAFAELDVEEFEIVATLDSHTSEICQEMDGKHFPMKDFEPGVTAPPFHVFCRSTTVPYFEDNYGGERAARNEDGDKTYYVPDNMKYPDWKKAFVDGDTSGLKPVVTGYTIKVNHNSEIAQKFGQEYYDNTHNIINSCENPNLKKLWEQYESDIKVGNAKHDGRAYCSGSKLYVNGENSVKGTSWQKPYQVFFHESGHAIDFLASDKISGTTSYASFNYKNELFPQTIKDEVQELVNEKAEVIKKAFKEHKGDWKWLHDAGYISDSSYDFYQLTGTWYGKEPKYSKSMAYKAVEKEIRALDAIAKSDISDILEGATGAKISCGFGHGASYWKRDVENLATEAFAEMLDSTMSNPESLKAIKKYLPKSYKIFEEIIETLIK